MNPTDPIKACLCCGSTDLVLRPALWDGLIAAWGLSPDEAAYVDRQQGLCCARCGSNLRSMALAMGVMRALGSADPTFRAFTRRVRVRFGLRVLELNEAGMLSQYLCRLRRRVIARYPEVDMQHLPYADESFDLVIHSDTLEHVESPVEALAECRRVLRRGGACAYTVPVVVARPTRPADADRPSYHGGPGEADPHYLVRTEYGGDFWRDAMRAGFDECRLYSPEHPAAHAIVAFKN